MIDEPVAGHAGGQHLQALDRRIDVARRAAGRGLLAEHVPGLERLAERQVNRARRQLAGHRKAELEVRREPLGRHRVAGAPHFFEHVLEIERTRSTGA